ncbi:MAG: LysM peptidoglycan-binding domain-containing protein [Atopobium sp.]|uniref:LysM peptidoglycan-binding domain-containing protein n=1 Tax=Atopobium sp. TaxID=1872650 RepID=UPI002A7568EA|nr:LysM peptidoglycan-binding domain-containing protein [Atopobium sp.]MDY2788216.1 LysM peptidoglycan-binding domain-containing protein [Atopobium sp.]MDY4522578.1 LysM peptidoglycan-binding domain-containing protein [Atopobium sp.]
MKTGRTYVTYTSDGSAACKPVITQFTVYEGGLHKPVHEVQPTSRQSSSMRQAVSDKLFTIATLSILIALFVGTALYGNAIAASQRTVGFDTIHTTEISVQPGESLWTIAANHGVEGHSTKDVVTYISNKNNLSNSMLTIGQKLIVPASA